MTSRLWFRRCIGVLLCLQLIQASGWAESSYAGQVIAVTPAASRNSKPIKVKDELAPNDVLRTDRAGRTRVTLRDGSILSVGSDSEFKILQHDAAAQQTEIELDAGRLRSRVVSITRPGGKFDVRTAVASAGVVGTDFYTEYTPANGNFRLICYSGVVKVTGSGRYAGQSASVRAGQMIVVGSGGFGPVQTTPNAVQQDTIAQTTSENAPAAASDSHLLRNVLIGAAVAAAGVVVGLVTSGTATAGAGEGVQRVPSQTSNPADKKTTTQK